MEVNVNKYGILSGNTASDNDIGFAAMRADLLPIQDRNSEIKFNLNFDPGTYQYENNRWLIGFKRIEIRADDVAFQNMYNNPAAGVGNNWVLTLPTMFRDATYEQETQVTAPVYKIETVEAASSVLQLSDISKINDFKIGVRILIYGFDQQGSGFPPNARFHEVHTIQDIDNVSGVIELTSTLKFYYDDRWPDAVASSPPVGAVRIMLLDRLGYVYPEFVSIRGLKVIAGPSPVSTQMYLTAQHVVLQNIEIDHLVPTEVRKYELINSKVFSMEVDKIIDKIHINGCDIAGGIGAFTGVNDCLIENCTFTTSIKTAHNFQGRNLTLRNNRFYSGPDWANGMFALGRSFPTDKISIIDNTIVDRQEINEYFLSIYGLTHIVVDEVSPRNGILLQDIDENRRIVWRKINYGTILRATGDTFKDSANKGRVTGLYKEGDYLVIEGDWKFTPIKGQVWVFEILKHPVVSFGNTLDGKNGFRLTDRDE